MRILVFGCGYYVIGDGEYTGTILPSILEFSSNFNFKEIIFIKNTKKYFQKTSKRIELLMSKSKKRIPYKIICQNDTDLISELKKKNNDIFCAIISTPDHTHFKLIKRCLLNKINVISVKPFTISLNEADQLVKLTNKNKLFCAVDFHKRYDRQNLLIKKLILENKSKVINLNINYSQIKEIPTKYFVKWSDKTNIFQYLAIHYVDLIFHIFKGIAPLRAMAIGHKKYLKERGIDTYDYITSIIEWKLPNKRQITSTINVNWIDPIKSSAVSEQNLTIQLDNTKIFSDQKNRGFNLYHDKQDHVSINPDFSKEYIFNNKSHWMGYGIDSFVNYFNELKKFKLNDNKFHFDERLCTFEQASKTVKVSQMVNKSLKNKNVWINA